MFHIFYSQPNIGCGGPCLLHRFNGQPNIPYRVMGVVPIFASHILWPAKHTIQSHGCGGPYLLHIFYGQLNIQYRVMGVVAHICFTYFMASQIYNTESWVWWPIFVSHILWPAKYTIQSHGCGGPYLFHIFYSQPNIGCGGPSLLHRFNGQPNIPYRVMGVVAHICFTYFTASQTYHTESWVWWPIFASHILQPVKHTIQSYGCGGPFLLHR